jgi:hypothetical protein
VMAGPVCEGMDLRAAGMERGFFMGASCIIHKRNQNLESGQARREKPAPSVRLPHDCGQMRPVERQDVTFWSIAQDIMRPLRQICSSMVKALP